jgi:ribose transport system substrate-binding protein
MTRRLSWAPRVPARTSWLTLAYVGAAVRRVASCIRHLSWPKIASLAHEEQKGRLFVPQRTSVLILKTSVRLAVIAVLAVATTASVAVSALGSSARVGKATPHAKVKLPMKTIGVMGPVDAAEVIHLGTSATDLAAHTLGWKTIHLDPNGDPAKTAADMTSLVNSHVNAIVLTVIEPATIQAGLRAAAKAHIPVIETLAGVHASPLVAATYWTPAVAENRLLTADMKKSVPRGSQVAAIYLPQFYNALIAQQLFQKSAKQDGWKIVASHDADLTNLVPDVKTAVGDIIRAHPQVKAIFGVGDFCVAGAVPAIEQSGAHVKLYSLHGVPSSIQFISTGLADAEISDYQKSSFIAIDALAAHFAKGTPIPKTTPKRFAFKMKIVTKANAGKGYPYPTSKIFAQFKARWSKLYTKAH